MSKIRRVKLKPQMIIRMNHLMRHGILQMTSIPKLVRAKQDTVLGVEATTLRRSAPSTAHIVRIEVMAQEVDIVAHEADDGRVLQQPCAVRLAAFAVAGFVQVVFDFEVGFSLRGAG